MTQFGLAIRNFVGPGEVPDIAAIYAFEESNGIQALVLELVEGSARGLVRRRLRCFTGARQNVCLDRSHLVDAD